MLSKWPIRYKLRVQLALLLVIFVALSAAGMKGLYSYRDLVKSMSGRAAELPFATELGQHVTDLRVTLTDARHLQRINVHGEEPSLRSKIIYEQFGLHLESFEQTLAQYDRQLTGNEQNSPTIGNSQRERETVRKIQESIARVEMVNRDKNWMLDETSVALVDDHLQQLQAYSAELPSYLHDRMRNFTDEVRVRYRTLIYVTWATSICAAFMLLLAMRLFFTWIFRPLRILIDDSRRVARGDFDHRIHLNSEDEMGDLARAMNDMTSRFQGIRDDLDCQVRERTMQVVNSEKLASIGFLAAGVAHEINNPMASIAMCAESLERRVDEGVVPNEEHAAAARKYLRMIQDEAFRCKSITEQLLDFSRASDGGRQNTDLRELIQGVIEMLRHLGKNQQKQIVLEPCKSVMVAVNPQEIKQVILNLITNAVDSLDPGGTVRLHVDIVGEQAELLVTDDGCGMTDEVLDHLFEPFFTRRRSGQGTGLGLSIVRRIVTDHSGKIAAESDGPGHGSRFRVTLPLAGAEMQKERDHRYQAA